MPDARIDNLAAARKVRFRYTGGAYGCASGRGMGLSLEHDGRRRGYALSLTAGLLWGVGLVKLALSMSFSTVSFQLDGYSSLGMLVGFGGSLALFVPLSVQKPELFSKPSAVIAFGALFIAGELLFLLPPLAPVLQWAQVTLSSTLHAVANVFFLCGARGLGSACRGIISARSRVASVFPRRFDCGGCLLRLALEDGAPGSRGCGRCVFHRFGQRALRRLRPRPRPVV